MNFSKHKSKSIERLSYVLMLIIFSSVLYLILSYLKKIPSDWGYLHILFLSIILILASKTLKRAFS